MKAEERYIDVGDARLWTALGGDAAAPPVLLCSGGPGCCDYLEPVADMVGDLASVARFEQRGCGRSDETPPYDHATCLSDLDAIRSALGIERLTVGGHSWGANVALSYALEHPDRVDGVLYIAGNGFQNDRNWSAAYHAELEARGERSPVYAYPPNMDVNREGTRSLRRYIQQPDLWRRISHLDVPVLVVVASRDIRPAWPAEQLAAALPRAQLAVIEGAEHCIWLDAEPADELRRLIRNFLAGQTRGSET